MLCVFLRCTYTVSITMGFGGGGAAVQKLSAVSDLWVYISLC